MREDGRLSVVLVPHHTVLAIRKPIRQGKVHRFIKVYLGLVTLT